ncbi:MAG: Lrp/AsnC family transcriptional regulator [Actinomycetia bacterium]|nr:Lrp/AsnC family transcriptional regulator [Actinomycetes bacterium]
MSGNVNGHIELSATDRLIISRLQGDVPIAPDPYQLIADDLGISLEHLLERLAWFKDQGILKRLAAIPRHQNIGFTANAMVVWNVPDEDAARVGKLFAAEAYVSHCYQRSALPGFPYSVYTMIHARSEAECIALAQGLSQLTGVFDYQLLFSVKEFKKSSMRYY